MRSTDAALSRRELLSGAAGVVSVTALSNAAVLAQAPAATPPTPIQIAPGVFTLIAPGDRIWCNVVWVEFQDHLLVLDAGSLSEAQTYLPIIQGTAEKPIRFVLNTHHHGDHSYGNEFWTRHGAMVMGNARIVKEFARDEPWRLHHFPHSEATALWQAEVDATHIQPPRLLLSSPTIFDDGTQRVELLYLGAAHTAADTIAWLPKHKILVSGDIVVNGPYNVMWNAHVLSWLDVLEKAEAFGAHLVVPGHGAPGPGSLVGGQRAYFLALRDAVKRIVARGGDAKDLRASVDSIRTSLMADPRIRRWVVAANFPLPELLTLSGQVGRFYAELTGKAYVAADSAEYAQAQALADVCCGALKGLHGFPVPPLLGLESPTV
jgi:cyclase